MERDFVEVEQYVMEAVVSLTTGDQSFTIDQGLLGPQPQDLPPADLLELRIRVKLNDFLQPEATQQTASTATQASSVPGWAWQVFPTIAEQAQQDFEAEVERLAEQRLTQHRWMLMQTWVQLGSLELGTIVLVAGSIGTGLATYGSIREGARLLYHDIVKIAVPFAYRISQKLYEAAKAPAGAAKAKGDAKPAAATDQVGAATSGATQDAVLAAIQRLEEKVARIEQKIAVQEGGEPSSRRPGRTSSSA